MSSNALSIYVAYQFILMLTKDFKEWTAYKLGLIDENGLKIRDPITTEERRYMTSWFNLVRNLKRALSKVPGGKSKFASFATAFAMLREDSRFSRIPDVVMYDHLRAAGQTLGFKLPKWSLNESSAESLSPGAYLLESDFYPDTHCILVNKVIHSKWCPPGCQVFSVIDTSGRKIFFTRESVERVGEETTVADIATPPMVSRKMRRRKRPKIIVR